MRKLFARLFTMSLLLVCCFSLVAQKAKKIPAWMPADFNPAVGVLLIEEVSWPVRQQRKIKEFLVSKYPYKYEIVSMNDISSNQVNMLIALCTDL